ncbi:hypothetical protein BHM03_00018720 [Ensete ventricosum]|nr:hypothetical protein BHM03_00018720 [Ensete ventricosum]
MAGEGKDAGSEKREARARAKSDRRRRGEGGGGGGEGLPCERERQPPTHGYEREPNPRVVWCCDRGGGEVAALRGRGDGKRAVAPPERGRTGRSRRVAPPPRLEE